MKKSLLALLVVPLLVGCGCNSKDDGGDAPVDPSKNKTAIETAIAEVGVQYDAFASSSGISLAGAKLITEHTVDDTKFEISYTVEALQTYSIEYVKLNEEKMRLDVEIPTFDELKADGYSGSYAQYKLVGKFSGGGEEQEKTWKIRVNAEEIKPVWEKIVTARTKEKGATVVTTGYVVAFMNISDSSEFSNGVWIADGADGLMLYGGLTSQYGQMKIGDMIMVVGKAEPYNGLFEIKNPSVSYVDDAPETIAEPIFTETDEARFNEIKSDANHASDPILMKEVSVETDPDTLTPTKGKEMSISLKIGETKVTYFCNKHTDLEERKVLVEHLKAHKGEKCTVKSVMGIYNDALQFNGSIIVNGGSLTDNFIF